MFYLIIDLITMTRFVIFNDKGLTAKFKLTKKKYLCTLRINLKKIYLGKSFPCI